MPLCTAGRRDVVRRLVGALVERRRPPAAPDRDGRDWRSRRAGDRGGDRRRRSVARLRCGRDGRDRRCRGRHGAAPRSPSTRTRTGPVDTGDPLPPGTDAVVRREDVVGGRRRSRASGSPYTNVRQVGEDVAAGDLAVPGRPAAPPRRPRRRSPRSGETTILVRRRPVVAILPSGDELVPLGGEPAAGRDRGHELAHARSDGRAGRRRRDPRPHRAGRSRPAHGGARPRAAGEADLVLLVAGSARGAATTPSPSCDESGEIVVQGVAVRPGHPVVLGLAGSTPVIGVPGYPVSAALAFELFGVRLLGELGDRRARHPTVRARARPATRSRRHPSEEWVRVRVGRIGEALVALPLRRGAGMLSSLARADGLVLVAWGRAGVAQATRSRSSFSAPRRRSRRRSS